MRARHLVTMAIAFSVSMLGCEIGHGGENDDLTMRFKATAAMIEAAFNSGEADELHNIAGRINEFAAAPGESTMEWRRSKLKLWLVAIQKAHSAIDPNQVGASDRPLINIAPKSSGGVVYDSGVDPNSIKDPDVRRDYERRLTENTQKLQTLLFQHALQQLSAIWITEVDVHLKGQYSDSRADIAEIDSALDALIVDTKFREELRGSLLADAK